MSSCGTEKGSCCGGCSQTVVDKAAAIARFDNDEELYREIVGVFLDDSPIQIQKLKDALESGDLVVVNRQAHSLKSASANIGAESMRHVAFELEKCSKSEASTVLVELCQKIESEFQRVQQFIRENGWA